MRLSSQKLSDLLGWWFAGPKLATRQQQPVDNQLLDSHSQGLCPPRLLGSWMCSTIPEQHHPHPHIEEQILQTFCCHTQLAGTEFHHLMSLARWLFCWLWSDFVVLHMWSKNCYGDIVSTHRRLQWNAKIIEFPPSKNFHNAHKYTIRMVNKLQKRQW